MDIKIFISCHKECKTLSNEKIFPIQVGTSLRKALLPTPFHDCDTTDFSSTKNNISAKNKRFCELTAQYYVWKNIDADYLGFFHYRRYLNLSKRQSLLGEIKVKTIDVNFASKFGFLPENIEKVAASADIIVPKKTFCFRTVYGQYSHAKFHHKEDLDFCLAEIEKNYPKIYPFAKKYMKSHMAYFCNMYIMKKEIFNDYFAFLMDILEKHEKAFPCANYNVQEYRVSGYLSERLFGVYLAYLEAEKPELKIKHVQKVFIENTDVCKN